MNVLQCKQSSLWYQCYICNLVLHEPNSNPVHCFYAELFSNCALWAKQTHVESCICSHRWLIGKVFKVNPEAQKQGLLRIRDMSVKESPLRKLGWLISKWFIKVCGHPDRNTSQIEIPWICWLRRAACPGRGTKTGLHCHQPENTNVTQSQMSLITSITVSLTVPQGRI